MKLNAFEGFLFGIMFLTCYIITQYGLNFDFIAGGSIGYFHTGFSACFRPITLLIITLGIFLLYRFAGCNELESFLWAGLVFSYFDNIFLIGNVTAFTINFFYRNFLILFCFGSPLAVMYVKDKYILPFNMWLVLTSLIVLSPFEYLLTSGFIAVGEDWYRFQYRDLGWGLRDIVFKVLPFLMLVLSSKRFKELVLKHYSG
jgi:hypothetical protein